MENQVNATDSPFPPVRRIGDDVDAMGREAIKDGNTPLEKNNLAASDRFRRPCSENKISAALLPRASSPAWKF